MMSQVAADALAKSFRSAAHCASRPGADRAYFLAKVDAVLDEYLRYRDYATEWDADQWGLDPDRWMEAERAEMCRRLGNPRPMPSPVEAI
jgi:hypothetical protein